MNRSRGQDGCGGMGGSVHALEPRWRTYFHRREEVAGCPRAGKVTEHQTVCPGKLGSQELFGAGG